MQAHYMLAVLKASGLFSKPDERMAVKLLKTAASHGTVLFPLYQPVAGIDTIMCAINYHSSRVRPHSHLTFIPLVWLTSPMQVHHWHSLPSRFGTDTG
jgi:hypothetical protein